jgi:CRISPR-associated protein Cas5d
MEHVIEVWGDFACFSAPANKVERFSYPCPTPSAARGVFDAIYCHPPEFRWQVTKVEILNFPQYIALRRNEVKEKVNTNAVKKWMSGKEEPHPIEADSTEADTKGRTQRQTMALSNVRYRLTAVIRPWHGFEQRRKAFDEQFQRRISKGKCFQQPYLGGREFVAFFSAPLGDARPVQFSQNLGLMLYDVFDLSKQNTSISEPYITMFRAKIVDGALMIPEFSAPSVLKPSMQEVT